LNPNCRLFFGIPAENADSRLPDQTVSEVLPQSVQVAEVNLLIALISAQDL
jgi:hypothetical protein